MDFEELRESINDFVRERDWEKFHTLENLAKSISIESGELLECFQWGETCDLAEVELELADVMTYGIILADKLGVSLPELVMKKLEISRTKYPTDKFKGSSLKYDQL